MSHLLPSQAILLRIRNEMIIGRHGASILEKLKNYREGLKWLPLLPDKILAKELLGQADELLS